jgi:hypothetical protein
MIARFFSEFDRARPSISRTSCGSRRPGTRTDRPRLAPYRAWASGLGVVIVAAVGVARVPPVAAQPLGTFRWQLQPYCNVVTIAVTQSGALFTLDGSDDQCGAAQRAAMVGTAFLNPDGSIGIGLSTVLAPGAAPVHIDARIDASSLNGPWHDSAGNTGTFVFTPGPGVGGPLRPVAPNGIAPGSITIAQLAPGVIGSGQINASQVQARVAGSCPVGQYLRGIHANGSVVCDPVRLRNITTIVDDPANNVGAFASLAVGTDGLPVIAHFDSTANALRVTHCGNAACTAGSASTTVDDTANTIVGYQPSMAIGADGLPIISHFAATAGALRVTHCGNIRCTAGNVSTTVDDPANTVGRESSIAIGVDGLPIISHRDVTAGALRVTHCGNVTCSAGHVSTTVDDPANAVGSDTSIAIGVDGLPIISYRDVTAGALRVTHCGNATCSTGNVKTTVDDPANAVGSGTSIAIGTDGLPVISHQDTTIGALRMTRCGNLTCTAAAISTTVDSPGVVGIGRTSIAIGVDGLPITSYDWANFPSGIQVTHCGTAACTAGNVSVTIDGVNSNVGSSSSIAIGADGLPIIAYYDVTAGALRVTKCGITTCQ